ncbi:hypothetical protein O181_085338 [Austropuccinia psidii MF-1]|uniref:Uncharacterized protein n=1 Tax=Austropuccinia psidii MF-1 TaxID=1389203 RepID=A0A9Q3FXB5_9BASI|nr:hypothetical protein [Austropuccinia psidii MF-1]
MNPRAQSYGYGYLDLINSFGTEELEELLFGYPSPPLNSTTFWDWVNATSSTPPSPPSLATILNVSSPSSYSEDVPEAAMAFYAFIKGKYDPRLFVPDPFNYFLKKGSASAIEPKRHHQQIRMHPYYLRPCDSNGQAIMTPKLY